MFKIRYRVTDYENSNKVYYKFEHVTDNYNTALVWYEDYADMASMDACKGQVGLVLLDEFDTNDNLIGEHHQTIVSPDLFGDSRKVTSMFMW